MIIDGASNDLAGLTAMQPMEKATDSDVHYLLPLPPGVHANADEMFGFFTYEFRLGHYEDIREELEEKRMVWTTAQGRFGRALPATGIQHPAPTLLCAVDRDENKVSVNAPYAVAVADGKNVTADPPRTQLWCLLYAQARQADHIETRNILLDDKQLDWRLAIEEVPDRNRFLQYDDAERRILRDLTVRNFKDDLSYAKAAGIYKLAETRSVEQRRRSARDGGVEQQRNQPAARAPWSAGRLTAQRARGRIPTGHHQHLRRRQRAQQGGGKSEPSAQPPHIPRFPGGNRGCTNAAKPEPSRIWKPQALPATSLGERRILRTSPLTERSFVCCPE